MTTNRMALVLGVGPLQGLGAALARRFAAEGLQVVIAGRSSAKLALVADAIADAGGMAIPVVADATSESDVKRLFEAATAGGRILDIAAYNVDSNLAAPLLETDLAMFTTLWQQNSLGAFLFGREAIKHMLPQQQGSLFFTGATASLRAKPPFTAFASAKAAVRALAQGMAREFGPQGIHVVHTIIDGVIDGERAHRQFSRFVAAKGADGLLKLEAIAQTYWAIHQQHPSAWTHELDLRPFKEPF
ncbi:SDR family NAD(P)-dependent oxidoreductase [Methylomonas methanica]|uniref:Glucose 1-dehydrogenase n=1 Tax=Methylomonas methanica TaxID=421 RepID=A0A177M604_METMH|nr:SDR family NAD(P)-dependent oxidoreductase [Methylomonas methanica]OAI01156.1 glucose 1-dehydrogenase [Methylomonas methanica]